MLSAFAQYDEEIGYKSTIASGLSYGGSERIINDDCSAATILSQENGLKPLYVLDNNDTLNPLTMLILEDEFKPTIYIAFSGTVNKIQFLFEILNRSPVSYDIHPAENSKVVEYFYDHYTNDFRNDLLQKLDEYKQTYRNYDFVFTGHSLGGPLAVVAASDTVLSNVLYEDTKVYIYSLAQPRVGNKEFLDQFTPKLAGFYRIVHYSDIVPHIPRCIHDNNGQCKESGIRSFYPVHAPQEIFYDKDFEEYIECDINNGEDPNCSNSIFVYGLSNHTYYFNMPVLFL